MPLLSHHERLGLGAERLQFLDYAWLEVLLRSGPLHRSVEVMFRPLGFAEPGITHRETVQVESVRFPLAQGQAFFLTVPEFGAG